MIAVAAAAALLFVQDPALSQAEYETFQTCHGHFEGAYAAGQILMADDAATLARFREVGEGLGELFDAFSADILRVQPSLDAQAGERAYRSGKAPWDGLAQGPDAFEYFAANGQLSDECLEVGGRLAAILDGAGD